MKWNYFLRHGRYTKKFIQSTRILITFDAYLIVVEMWLNYWSGYKHVFALIESTILFCTLVLITLLNAFYSMCDRISTKKWRDNNWTFIKIKRKKIKSYRLYSDGWLSPLNNIFSKKKSDESKVIDCYFAHCLNVTNKIDY